MFGHRELQVGFTSRVLLPVIFLKEYFKFCPASIFFRNLHFKPGHMLNVF